jgi:hypothetical protein
VLAVHYETYKSSYNISLLNSPSSIILRIYSLDQSCINANVFSVPLLSKC